MFELFCEISSQKPNIYKTTYEKSRRNHDREIRSKSVMYWEWGTDVLVAVKGGEDKGDCRRA